MVIFPNQFGYLFVNTPYYQSLMEIDDNNSRVSSRNSRRKSPSPSGIVSSRSLIPNSSRMSITLPGHPSNPTKMLMSQARRSSSGIFITTMFSSRFRHLQKLHSDGFGLGLNAVCYPGLPVGTMFRSSLPATPVSTPIYRESFHQFTEQSLRERLCRTPSPRKNRGFLPPSLNKDVGLNLVNNNESFNNSDSAAEAMDVSPATTPIVDEPVKEMEESQDIAGPSEVGPGGDSPSYNFKSSNASKTFLGPNPKKLFVGNISYRIDENELRRFFRQFGKVTFCQVVKDRLIQRSKGFGFVAFETEEEVKKVLNLSEEELVLDNRRLRVAPAQPKTVKQMKFTVNERADERIQQETQMMETLENSIKVKPSTHMASVVKTTKVSNINDLDDNIMLSIFALLDIDDRTKCEFVCKRWYDVTKSSWKSVKTLDFTATFFSFTAPPLTTKTLYSILVKCPNLKAINLESVTHELDEKSLEIIGCCCPAIESMNFTKGVVTDYCLKTLAEKCPDLKHMNLTNCPGFGEKGLWWFVKCAHKLESLNLHNQTRVTGKCFRLFGSQIKKIDISWCDKIQESGIEELGNGNGKNIWFLTVGPVTCKMMEIIGHNLINLRQLKIVALSKDEDDVTGFKTLANLVNLEELIVPGSLRDADDQGLLTVIGRCHKLKRVIINAATTISDESVQYIHEFCPNLEELGLDKSKITDRSLVALSHMVHLKKLDLRRTNIASEGLMCVFESCPQLNFVDINDTQALSRSLLQCAIDIAKERKRNIIIAVANERVHPEKVHDVKLLDYLFEADYGDYEYDDGDDFVKQDTHPLNPSFFEAEDPMEEEEASWIS